MKLQLQQFTNVMPEAISARKKDYRTVYTFLCGVAIEYSVNFLKKDQTDPVFHVIMEYLRGDGSLSAQTLWKERLGEDRELQQFLRDVSFSETDAGWEELCRNFVWETEGGQSTFRIGAIQFSCPQTFLFAEPDGDRFLALHLQIRNDGDYITEIKLRANEAGRIDRKASSSFYQLLKSDTSFFEQFREDAPRKLLVGEDEFFSLTEDLKAADDDQRAAISSGMDKNLLILAGAGSGKTRSLVGRLTYLHLVCGIELKKIRLLTYTKAAAEEMGRRGKEQIMQAYAAKDIRKTTTPFVLASTIDAFFRWILDHFYLDVGFTDKPTFCYGDNAIQGNLITRIIRENHLESVFREYCDKEGKYESLTKVLEDHINRIPINVSGIDNLLNLYIEYQKRMNLVADFASAAYLLKGALSDKNGELYRRIVNLYDCILVDEFQDINVLQNEVLSNLYESRIHFTFVGDDDQTIYTWRGADNAIIRAIAEKDSVRCQYLTTNYRNNQYIVKAGNDILAHMEDRAKGGHLIKAAREFGTKVLVATYDDKFANLAHEVKNLYNKRKDKEKICILYRANFKQKDGTIKDKLLMALGIEDVPISVQEEIPEKLSHGYKLLKSILRIRNGQDVRDACSTIQELLSEKLSRIKIKRLVLGKIAQPEEEQCDKGFTPYQVFCLSESVNGKYTNVTSLTDVIGEYNRSYAKICERQISEDRGVQDECLALLYDYSKQFALEYPLKKTEFQGFFNGFEEQINGKKRQLSQQNDGVIVTTIHNAKGLEFETVFVIGLNEGEYPNLSKINDDYNKKLEELDRLSKSKENLQKLKSRIENATINALLVECKSKNWNENLRDGMGQFFKEIEAYREDFLDLTEDAANNYIEAYEYYIKQKLNLLDETIRQMAKELLGCIERADAKEEQFADLEEGSEQYQALYEEWKKIRAEAEDLQKKKERREETRRAFGEMVKHLTEFYDLCQEAKGYFFEQVQLRNSEAAVARLRKEREDKIKEETRLFYVAVSRAINRLYLCYSENADPSLLIDMIDPSNCERYVMRTYGQEEEEKRLRATVNKVRKEMLRQEEKGQVADVQKIDDGIREILNYSQSFQSVMLDYIREYRQKHHFEDLPPASRGYIDNAIGLMVLAERLGYNFEAEVLHNLQRFAEVFIRGEIGHDARAFKTDERMAILIADEIRRAAGKRCKTQKPGEGYIIELLSNRERKYHDELEKCKNLAIEGYAVGCGRYPEADPKALHWKKRVTQSRAETFLCEIIDLSNIRNDAIHQKKESWRTDNLPYAWKIAENLVTSFEYSDADIAKGKLAELDDLFARLKDDTLLNDTGVTLVGKIKNMIAKEPHVIDSMISLREGLSRFIHEEKVVDCLMEIGMENIRSIKNKTIDYETEILTVFAEGNHTPKEIVAAFAVWKKVFS